MQHVEGMKSCFRGIYCLHIQGGSRFWHPCNCF